MQTLTVNDILVESGRLQAEGFTVAASPSDGSYGIYAPDGGLPAREFSRREALVIANSGSYPASVALEDRLLWAWVQEAPDHPLPIYVERTARPAPERLAPRHASRYVQAALL